MTALSLSVATLFRPRQYYHVCFAVAAAGAAAAVVKETYYDVSRTANVEG